MKTNILIPRSMNFNRAAAEVTKLLSIVRILTLACLLSAAPATAQVNYAVSGNTAHVTSSPGASGAIVIASTYLGYPVTYIEESAFIGCTNLTNVIIGNSVVSLGDMAFFGCRSLTSVIIPNSVTSIGHEAFRVCTNLTSVTIPNSVTNLGGAAFGNCTSLTNVIIGNSVVSLGGMAFWGCRSLTSVIIGNSVTNLGGGAFYGGTSLTNVIIGNRVISIGGSAFYGCRSLTSVTIPNSVAIIRGAAFQSCTNLTNFTFLGNAPSLPPDLNVGGITQFSQVGAGAKAYYSCGTTGWEATYGGLPTVMLCAPRIAPAGAGMKPGGFGFTLTCLTNPSIVVEASANLVNWQPIWTNTLSGASADFFDPEWLHHPSRFYRARTD
jgi:hypothetical protein